MSSELNLNPDNGELFKETLVHELEIILEQAKSLNLNKLNGAEAIETLLNEAHRGVEIRCDYLRGIAEENERLANAKHALEGRTSRRNVTSLLEAAKTKQHDSVEANADETPE